MSSSYTSKPCTSESLPSAPYPIEKVVPHSGTMCLLETLVHCDDVSVHASVTLTEHSVFAQDQGVPGWVGIEYMAQAVAAYGGVQALQAGKPVSIGFLVGTRKYLCDLPFFPLHKRVDIRADQVMRADNGLAVFDCIISVNGTEVASASLNVFQPDDVDAFLESEAQSN